MKQLKSSREYWRSVITNWQKRYICKWRGREGKGKVCQFIPILVKFTFLSNSWLNKLQNMPSRIFYPWTCDRNLVFATQNWKSFARKIVIPCVDIHFFFKFYSWHFFWNIRISFLAVSDSNGCPNLNTRHFGPGAANHDCPLGGGGGQMMVIQEM